MALTKDEKTYLQRNLDAARKVVANPECWADVLKAEKEGRNDPNWKNPLGFAAFAEGLDIDSTFYLDVLRAQRYLSRLGRGENPEATERAKEVASDPIMVELHSVTPALKGVVLPKGQN